MNESDFERQLAASGLSSIEAANKARLFVEATSALRATGTSIDDFDYWFVPGRIEFLGKHTDYAGGRSLICALERGFCVASAARDDDRIRIIDAGRNAEVEFSFAPDLIAPASHWSNYPMTVARRLARNFPGKLRGADIALISDLPSAAGLSSSSALVVAIFSALARANALDHRPEYTNNIRDVEDLAGYLGAVENGSSFGSLAGSGGVGTFGGSQDHTAILCCRPGQLSQYSFCPVSHERSISLPDDHSFVIGVSGVIADKTGEALDKYNRVSRLTSEILLIWRTVTGRADESLMAAATSSVDAPDRIRKALKASRASAFSTSELINRFEQLLIESSEIIPAVAQALDARQIDKLGALVDRSQDCAERLLGNQVSETIALARLAREIGAVAASAFGAGFGGSVWTLVKSNDVERFISEWSERYRFQFPVVAEVSAFFTTCAGPATIGFGQGSMRVLRPV
jgi:galactokinase